MVSSPTLSHSYESSGSRSSSSICYISNTDCLSPENSSSLSTTALKRPFETIESILEYPDFNIRSDAKIIVAGNREIRVHSSILSVKSPFFKNLFNGGDGGKRRDWKFEMKELVNNFDVGFHSFVAILAYLYSGKLNPLPKDVCICVDDECSHIGCWPLVSFMLEVLYASFVFRIPELVSLYQRHLLEILDKVAVDDILVVLFVANMCDKACDRLLKKCIEIVVNSDINVLTLEKALPYHIVKQIRISRLELGLGNPGINNFPDKHVKRIYRALDSGDVKSVKKLLRKGHTNLDDAYALHYVVAYCSTKTAMELLDLDLGDVNHRNPRGYTVLHVAAMRKEPRIIVSLLEKGARPSDLTLDGRKAIQISKRLTRFVDYNRNIETEASHKDQLCIEILKQAKRKCPSVGEDFVSLAMEGHDLLMKLLYLEERVCLVKLLFPSEAKVAMDIAQVDDNLEFTHLVNSWDSPAGQRTPLDLNVAPFKIKEEHLNRMKVLARTVELGKRFFPHCSEALDKIMNADDLVGLAYLRDTTEEHQLKKKRYRENQDIICKAFNKDKVEFDRSVITSRLRHHPHGPVGLKRKW